MDRNQVGGERQGRVNKGPGPESPPGRLCSSAVPYRLNHGRARYSYSAVSQGVGSSNVIS